MNKAYIVANEQQEREVLEVLCANGMKYFDGTSSQFRPLAWFPYVIYESDNSNVLKSGRVPKIKYSTDILYDGRKEENMSDKYVVSQEFMNKLKEWRDNNNLIDNFIGYVDLGHVPVVVTEWWKADMANTPQTNNRLIAIIRWVNGEDVFEVEKPKKWVVRSKDIDGEGDYGYIFINPYNITISTYSISQATRFETKEEAQEWANAHQEVVEVDE